jgi:hypothetical protein
MGQQRAVGREQRHSSIQSASARLQLRNAWQQHLLG